MKQVVSERDRRLSDERQRHRVEQFLRKPAQDPADINSDNRKASRMPLESPQETPDPATSSTAADKAPAGADDNAPAGAADGQQQARPAERHVTTLTASACVRW